jgi:hypothetical protein
MGGISSGERVGFSTVVSGSSSSAEASADISLDAAEPQGEQGSGQQGVQQTRHGRQRRERQNIRHAVAVSTTINNKMTQAVRTLNAFRMASSPGNFSLVLWASTDRSRALGRRKLAVKPAFHANRPLGPSQLSPRKCAFSAKLPPTGNQPAKNSAPQPGSHRTETTYTAAQMGRTCEVSTPFWGR